MSRLGFSALMLIVLAACASKPTYEFDYDHNFDFSSFKTYHWYDDMVHTRESEYRKFNPSDKRIREVVGRIRETVPGASCLLIGPSDRPVRREDGGFEDRPRTHQLVRAQHRVAVEMGCGFFDLVAFSGGPLSLVEWAAADPSYAAGDHVHYTRRGYERLGYSLLAGLLEGYDRPAELAAD